MERNTQQPEALLIELCRYRFQMVRTFPSATHSEATEIVFALLRTNDCAESDNLIF